MCFIHKGQHCLFTIVNVTDVCLKREFILIYSAHGISNSSNDGEECYN